MTPFSIITANETKKLRLSLVFYGPAVLNSLPSAMRDKILKWVIHWTRSSGIYTFSADSVIVETRPRVLVAVFLWLNIEVAPFTTVPTYLFTLLL